MISVIKTKKRRNSPVSQAHKASPVQHANISLNRTPLRKAHGPYKTAIAGHSWTTKVPTLTPSSLSPTPDLAQNLGLDSVVPVGVSTRTAPRLPYLRHRDPIAHPGRRDVSQVTIQRPDWDWLTARRTRGRAPHVLGEAERGRYVRIDGGTGLEMVAGWT